MSIKNTNFSSKEIEKMLKNKNSVYFIGIGGVSMSCLAIMTQKLGFRVGGSDRVESATSKQLENKNIVVNYNHSPDNIIAYDVIVYTVAISENNEEYVNAQKMGKPCISRADFLGFLMTHYKNRIGVSGMHGKSTTSSMLAEVFLSAELDPTILLGAELPSIKGCYKDGGNNHFVFEACEYMDSFLSFTPTLEVILNIELDHTDYFPSLSAVKRSFEKYLNIPTVSCAVLNFDDENVIEVSKSFYGKTITYGIKNKNVDFYADNISFENGNPTFDLYHKGKKEGSLTLSVSGIHNVSNALAVCAVAYEFGIPFETVKKGLLTFLGAKRRMEYKGSINDVAYYEDYAHHPTEIKATISSAKNFSRGDIWCIFQSHTYSRTAELFDDFVDALKNADRLVSLDIYAARETDTKGVSGELIAEKVGKTAVYSGSFENAAKYVKENAKENDMVIVMGAGDVFHVFDYLSF